MNVHFCKDSVKLFYILNMFFAVMQWSLWRSTLESIFIRSLENLIPAHWAFDNPKF